MASALENYVNNVRTLCAAGNYRQLAEHLIEGITVELLSKNWTILDNVLETLDMSQHTLGVLYVLLAKFNTASSSFGLQSSFGEAAYLMNLVRTFVQFCDPQQVRCAIHAYYELFHAFTDYMVTRSCCVQAIRVLADAIEKIRLHDAQLTPIHADLCLISLKAKSFKTAIEIMDHDMVAISTGSETKGQNTDTNTESKYFLLFYYYGGMIYTAAKQHRRALDFFEICISTPAVAMSLIMLEAYKKYILVSIILAGRILPLPKYTSAVVPRFMKPAALVYHDFASTCALYNRERIQAFISKNSEVFARDKNMGLVKQVADVMTKKCILRLTKTFITLPLSDVATRAFLPNSNEAENNIINMIQAGEIYASIDQQEGMVMFYDDPENFDSSEMFLTIQNDMTKAMDIIALINQMDEDISLNPQYIKKTANGSGSQDEEITQQSKPFTGDPTD